MCPSLVWATGAWAINLVADGIELPIQTARQGQLLTQSIQPKHGPILRGPNGAIWASALTSLPSYDESKFAVIDIDSQDSLRYDDTTVQNGEGGLLIGSSVDQPGALNPHIGIAATQSMITNALTRYPEHSSLGIVGVWAGVTSWTEDDLPIVGKHDGIYLNVAHSRGVASAPISSEILAGLMSSDISQFAEKLSVDRFQ
jgi:glycine/D-amino acid oxidase-like deaminating enzyme